MNNKHKIKLFEKTLKEERPILTEKEKRELERINPLLEKRKKQLNLGCGKDIKEGFINADIFKLTA